MDKETLNKLSINGSKILISAKKLKTILEPFLHKFLTKKEYEIYSIDPINLITYNRLDIIYKILFLEGIEANNSYKLEGYSEHIKAFNFGKFKEYGNSEKNSSKKFIQEFLSIDKNIYSNGFKIEKSVIPIANDGSILNGSHRVAASCFREKEISYVQLDHNPLIYNYQYFTNRLVNNNRLQDVIYNYIKLSNHCHIALIWPRSNIEDEVINKYFSKIVYQKKISLTLNGLDNLIKNVYKDEPWIGNIDNNYGGSMSKTSLCFAKGRKLRFIVFDNDNKQMILRIKEKIRRICGVGNHSIHTTDSKDESIKLARLLLYENSIIMLNKINKEINLSKKINSFEIKLNQNNVNPNNILLDHNILFNLYGIKGLVYQNPISYFSLNSKLRNIKNIDSNNIKLHKDEKMISFFSNPSNYFWYNNLKILSINGALELNNMGIIEIERRIKKIIKCGKPLNFFNFYNKFLPYFFYFLSLIKFKIANFKNIFLKKIELFLNLKT